MSETKRKIFTGEFKAKVALEAIRGIKTVNEIGQEYGVHPTQVGLWKKELQEHASGLFDAKRGPKPVSVCQPGAAVFRDWPTENGTGLAQKKVWDQPVETRKQWVGAIEPLAPNQ